MTIRRIRRGAAALGAAALVLALAPAQSVTAAPPSPGDPAAPGSAGQATAEAARVASYWTPARRAAATPRDLLLDERGNGYLRTAAGLQPYGTKPTPQAKPGGGSGDTTPPSVTALTPGNGTTVTTSAITFSATVLDDVGLRSVSFKVGTQSFTPAASGSTYSITLSPFSDGPRSWSVVAKDTAGNTTTASASFTVDTSGGSGGGTTDPNVVTNAPWKGGAVQSAAGRIYFEMPTNSRKTRWAGYVCSGTVVADQAADTSVILTAAHCVYDDAYKAFARNVLFIPNQAGTSGSGTDRDCTNDPLGCWTPTRGVVDTSWTNRTFPDNIPWDYAYYVVPTTGRHSAGSASGVPDSLETATGTLPMTFAAPDPVDAITHALGYSYSDDPNFMYCAESMGTEGTANWWLPTCGLSGGSSGGPWIQPMNTTTRTGPVISVNSWGYTNKPGMAGPKLNGTSAQCLFLSAQGATPAGCPAVTGTVVQP